MASMSTIGRPLGADSAAASQRSDPLDVVPAIEVVRIDQDGAQPRVLCADDVNVIQVADMERRLGRAACPFADDVKEAGIGLLDPFDVRVADCVEERCQADALQHPVERAVGV
jgi:hypothetical protein